MLPSFLSCPGKRNRSPLARSTSGGFWGEARSGCGWQRWLRCVVWGGGGFEGEGGPSGETIGGGGEFDDRSSRGDHRDKHFVRCRWILLITAFAGPKRWAGNFPRFQSRFSYDDIRGKYPLLLACEHNQSIPWRSSYVRANPVARPILFTAENKFIFRLIYVFMDIH